MDGATTPRAEQQLAEADRQVTEGERLVANQRQLIDERRNGHDIEISTTFLFELEESLRLHVEHRDRLRRELAGSEPPLEVLSS
jgi:hypothetical protein